GRHACGGYHRPWSYHSGDRRPASRLHHDSTQIGFSIESQSRGRGAMQRLTLCIVPCSNLMPSMMVATLGIALPEIREAFSLSTIAAGSLFSVMMIIAALTSSVAGRLADRIGRKTVLITGLSLLALGFGLAGVSSHPILFFFFLALTGMGYGFTPPSLYAIMSDLLPNRAGSAPASFRSPTASAAPSAPYSRVGSSPPSVGARPSSLSPALPLQICCCNSIGSEIFLRYEPQTAVALSKMR